MRAKRILTALFLLLSVLALAACISDAADVAPDVETADEGPYPAPLESDAAAEAPAYPAPQDNLDAAGAPAADEGAPYPAPLESAEPAVAPAYPAPQEAPASGGEQAAAIAAPYPAPGGDAYPAPQEAVPLPAAEEDGLLARADDAAALTQRLWRFEQFSGQSGQMLLPSPEVPEINSVEFFADGRVSIVAGCNVASGDYSAADGAINIQAVNETQRACAGGSLGTQFLQWLNQVSGYRIEGETLALLLPEASGEVALHGSELLSFGDQYVKFLLSTAAPGLSTAQPETMEELMDASLEELVYHEGETADLSFGQAPGAVVLIQSPAGSMVKAEGLASLEEGRLMAALDRLEIGSNTMMFTGVLLAQLQEEGVLSLDDPLGLWLPDMVQRIPNGDSITLRHLATHTAGVPDYAGLVIGPGASDSEALRSGYAPDELVAIATESFDPDFAPGEPGQWQFSNTGYILLGMVLEAATGQSYGDLLQQRIFGPLGMNNTELLEGVPYPNSIVDGYYVFPYDVKTTEWNGSQGWSAGAIISTAADMAKFARALMTGAVFKDPATLAVMTDFVQVSENAGVASAGGSGYGIGLIEFAPGLWGHRGQTIGFTSIVAMEPARDFVLIALTNSAEGAAGGDEGVIGYYLELDDR